MRATEIQVGERYAAGKYDAQVEVIARTRFGPLFTCRWVEGSQAGREERLYASEINRPWAEHAALTLQHAVDGIGTVSFSKRRVTLVLTASQALTLAAIVKDALS